MRSRNIKPDFFFNEFLCALGWGHALLFQGLWMMADREGRLEDRPGKIKFTLPLVASLDIDKALEDLQTAPNKFIERYEVDGVRYIQVVNFHKHQNPHHMEHPSVIPPPPNRENKFNHKPVTKAQRFRILNKHQGICAACGSNDRPHIDHIKPISKGGTSDDRNLQVLCRKCNLIKNNRRVDVEPRTSRVQVDGSPADSGFLIPDPLIPPNPQRGHGFEFEKFWEAYPKRIGKGAAEKAWSRLKPDEACRKAIINAIAVQKKSVEWQRESGQFIPHPATWLNQKRWLDEVRPVFTVHQADPARIQQSNEEAERMREREWERREALRKQQAAAQ